MTRQGVDGKEQRLCPSLERQAGKRARQRQRQTCGRMSLGRVEIGSAGRDARRELQARPFAAGGVTLERGERERVRRRDLDQPRLRHRLDQRGRQRKRLDRGAQREQYRTACGLAFAAAERRLAPPGDPDRREIGVAGTRARLPDLVIEAGEGVERVAARSRRVERAEPLVAGVCPRQRGAVPISLRQRLGAGRGRRRHGAAIRTAATRRSSDCMTL